MYSAIQVLFQYLFSSIDPRSFKLLSILDAGGYAEDTGIYDGI